MGGMKIGDMVEVNKPCPPGFECVRGEVAHISTYFITVAISFEGSPEIKVCLPKEGVRLTDEAQKDQQR